MVEGPDLSKSDNALQNKNETISKKRGKEEKQPTKVVIRKLPGSMTEQSFIEHVSPLFEHDYFYFVQGEKTTFGEQNYSRAYINFTNLEDVFTFTTKFDDYIFLDNSGQEYPAIVEFAPFQRIPKNRNRKNDPMCGTIEEDPEYQDFVQLLESEEQEHKPNQIIEHYFDLANEENEEKVSTTTPLIEFITLRKHEWNKFKEEKKEGRRRRDLERRKLKEENKRIKRENKELNKMKLNEKVKEEKRKDTENKAMDDIKMISSVRIKGKSYQEERQRDLARRKMEEKAAKGDGKENKDSEELEKISFEQLSENDTEKCDNVKEIKTDKRSRDGKYDDDYKHKKNYDDKKPYRDDDRKSGYLREKDEKKLHPYGLKKREYGNGYENDGKYKTTKNSGYFYEDYKTRNHSSYQKGAHSSKYSQKSKDYEEKAAKRYDIKPKKYDNVDYKDSKKNLWEKEFRKSCEKDNDKKLNAESGIFKKEKHENDGKGEDNLKESKGFGNSIKTYDNGSETESTKNKESRSEDKKDDRAERRIKNKDRPALEIYRPGMGRFSRQRLERNKSTDSKDGD